MNRDDSKIWSILIASITFIIILLPIKIVLLKDVSDFFLADKVTDYLMTYFAAITLLYTLFEYRSHRERVKAEVLGQYNERYSKDEHINKVVKYIISYMEGEIIYTIPTIHDAEMFMRFFEEMQIQIDQGRLDEKNVYDLFAYYALVFDANAEIRSALGIKDYEKNDGCWDYYTTFTSNMAMHHLLKNSTWKTTHCNNGCEIIKITDKTLSTGKDFKEISFYKYKHGIIKTENMEFKFVFSGSDQPNELHCKANNNIYHYCPR